MEDVYLKDFAAASPGLTDYLVLSGGNGNDQDFKALVSAVAALIVESYEGSTLAGSAQSVQDAFDSLQDALESIEVTDPESNGNLVITLGGGAAS